MYFSEFSDKVNIPLDLTRYKGQTEHKLSTVDSTPKLRRGQVGAIHGLAQHFIMERDEPAIVVMPTGSGKTGVMVLAAFLLAPKRVLIVTPSRLVRSQIAAKFADPNLLAELGASDGPLDRAPYVFEVTEQMNSLEKWKALEAYDVVVSTINSVSPGYKAVVDPPDDLFDLVLIDEAHHSAARTWNSLLERYKAAPRILFTATPFRRDSREITGTIVFAYPARMAFDDRIFGRIEYLPVLAPDNATEEEKDIAIAKEAEAAFRSDQAAGLEHFLIVRVDGKSRANALAETYKQHTNLRLKVVHSNYAYRTIQRDIESLKNHQIDGVICVNMLGEGFDFPNLKIAAIHSPHRSLAVTLQFIGRFARTNDSSIKDAKFLAVPNEIKIESEMLYQEDTAWEEIVPNLLDKVVQKVVSRSQRIPTFVSTDDGDPALDDLSLYSLVPYFHVKVYAVTKPVNLDAVLELGKSVEVVYRKRSHELNAAVVITRSKYRPEWVNNDRLEGVNYALHIIYWNEMNSHLFVCSTIRSEPHYEQFASIFCPGGAWPLVHSEIKRATLDLTDLEFFNIGMRNRIHNNTSESYRTVSGPTPTNGIKISDGIRYHEGHVFGKGMDGDTEVTIGMSSLSKIWSNKSALVDELVEWCSVLSVRIASDREVKTNTFLDRLGTGELAKTIPLHPIAAEWHKYFYENPCQVEFVDGDGVIVDQQQLIDCSIEFSRAECSDECLVISLIGDSFTYEMDFRLDRRDHFAAIDPNSGSLNVIRRGQNIPFMDMLNGYPLRFFFADFSSLSARELLRPKERADLAFDFSSLEAIDWAAEAVSLTREIGDIENGVDSVHGFVKKRLSEDGSEVVFYDHGSGEIADFLAVRDTGEAIEFGLYHCKGSSEKQAGARVEDLYELSGQVVKSVRWLGQHKRLRGKIRERMARKVPSHFLVGDLDAFDDLVKRTSERPARFKIYAVQPGLSRASGERREDIGYLLAMVGEYVVEANCEALGVLCSA